jgi:hypothetical protein
MPQTTSFTIFAFLSSVAAEFRQDVDDLFNLLFSVAARLLGQRFKDARSQMTVEDSLLDRPDCADDRSQLDKDIDTIPALFDHPLDAPDLTLDFSETDKLFLMGWITFAHRLAP